MAIASYVAWWNMCWDASFVLLSAAVGLCGNWMFYAMHLTCRLMHHPSVVVQCLTWGHLAWKSVSHAWKHAGLFKPSLCFYSVKCTLFWFTKVLLWNTPQLMCVCSCACSSSFSMVDFWFIISCLVVTIWRCCRCSFKAKGIRKCDLIVKNILYIYVFNISSHS